MTEEISDPRIFSRISDFNYICPQCGSGSLLPDQETFRVVEPEYSKIDRNREGWEHSDINYRFTVMYVCAKNNCGEIAFVSGDGGVDYIHIDGDQYGYRDYLEIKSFFPSPRLCYIPSGVPFQVKMLLEKSFSLYWLDAAAAANALRASLEALLDNLGIRRKTERNDGRISYASLQRRLEIWSISDEEHADLCFVLKEIGNLGSHGELVESRHYLGVLGIYSHVLRDIFENDAEKIQCIARKIRNELSRKEI
ncbi:DUF4145 domain-containing protein [Tistrella mobilis]|uniref:DUF4145 domain-containing protein n=1 Tax=Tistrella mobilis TaxID=171437 RepID=UPI003557E4C5